MNFDTRLLKHLDKLLVLAMFALVTIGVVVITSAARGYIGPEGAGGFVKKQLVAAAVGLVLMIIAMLFDYEEYARMTWVLYGLNCALLAVVLAMGKLTNGAQSWIPLGPLGQFQPSEFGKVMLILTLGHHLNRMERLDSIWDLITPAIHVAPLMALLLLQPDLGTSLVFVVITAAMIYMAGFPGWKLGLLGGGPIGAVVGWYFAHVKWPAKVTMWPLKDYQIKRLQNFFDPSADPTDSGYQVMQSKISIGSGGWFGRGLYKGTQNQLGFLPEQHTDFIFSVVGEELGFVGGATILFLFLVLLWRVMAIAATSRDRYGTLIATGVTAMIGFHVLENVGMTLGVMPVTGIPLPFISYGGSALMANMVAIGLVLNVGMRRQKIMF
ncbi:MAG TPA: rod shape-determining protein RodA [Symbiobacteriaceae bacterium]|nr:rod shape-determining protein RodA [Symbiobacteriaceae bacterium]